MYKYYPPAGRRVKLGHPVTLIYLKVRAVATDYAYSDAIAH